ncbi:MAG: acyl carrier protein [Spirochaetaceae bacterium]|nr:acyl carrier protein [Spirochaetaceae bacterium]
MTEKEIFDKLKSVLVSEFEVPADKITPESRLFEDLQFDSIDAVDFIVKMKNYIPDNKGAIDPEVFKSVQTLQDVATALLPYLN